MTEQPELLGLTFVGPDLSDVSYRCIEVRGHVELSSCFRYDVDIRVAGNEGVSMERWREVIRGEVVLSFGTSGRMPVFGVVTRVDTLPVDASATSAYRLEVRPHLSRFNHGFRTRVFQNMSVLDIVKSVLKDGGIKEGELLLDRTNGEYPEAEYTVQYRESDFAFISRLMERFGIHYHFDFQPEATWVILGDDARAFRSEEDGLVLEHSIEPSRQPGRAYRLLMRQQPTARRVVVRDYNYKTPRIPVRAQAPADRAAGFRFADYLDEHVGEESDSGMRAERLAELHVGRTLRIYGECTASEVSAGTVVTIQGHPNPDFNRDVLVTSVEEDVRSDQEREGTLSKHFVAMPLEHEFRPERRTPWPAIHGVVTGKIDGEVRSTKTPIDEEGRYKVMLPYDLAGKRGGKASRYIRMAQPSAGSGYGMHIPLHIGTEVAIAHLNGDPDRPVILGAIPNAETTSPVTDSNAQQSCIRTGSGIQFVFDDDC